MMQILFHIVMEEVLGLEPHIQLYLGMAPLEVGTLLREQHGLLIVILETFGWVE